MNFWSNPKWYWVRWILFLPLSLGSYFLVFGVANIFFTYTRSYGDEPGTGSLVNLIAPGLAGLFGSFACIKIGGTIAPKAKTAIAFVLMMVMCGFIGISIYLMVKNGAKFNMVLEVLGMVVGSFWGLFNVKNKEDE